MKDFGPMDSKKDLANSFNQTEFNMLDHGTKGKNMDKANSRFRKSKASLDILSAASRVATGKNFSKTEIRMRVNMWTANLVEKVHLK
jgi:hypothetical protein